MSIRSLITTLVFVFAHPGVMAHGDPLAADAALVFGYVGASGASSRIDTALISQTGSGGPLIEVEVHDGLFFVLGLPKGEYRLVSLKGERRILGRVSSTIELGYRFRFLLDGSPTIFLGAYNYTTTNGPPAKLPAAEHISSTFQVAAPPVRRELVSEPSELELLTRIENAIVSKSEFALYRQYAERIARRKAEIVAAEPLSRSIQTARSNGRWSSVFGQVRRLTERGDPVFLNALAQMYLGGIGTPVDQEQALAIFVKAAAQDYAPAQFQIGHFLVTTPGPTKNPVLGARWLESAAALGSGEAQFDLGQIEHAGVLGSVNEAKALALYEKASVQGLARAWTNLGVLSASAKTLPRNPANTRINFRKAAAAGESMAHFNLALDYLRDNTASSLERSYFHALLADSIDTRGPCIPPALWVAARLEVSSRDLLPMILREEAARQSCMVAISSAQNVVSQIEARAGQSVASTVWRDTIKQEVRDYLAKRALMDADIAH